MQPSDFILSDQDDQYLNTLKMAFAIMSDTIVPSEIHKRIKNMRSEGFQSSQVYQIIEDVKELFGDITTTNKQFDRSILRQKLLKISAKCERVGDYEGARKCIEAVIKMDGLDKHDTAAINWDYVIIPEIVYTDDPKIILEAEDAEIIADETGLLE